MNGERPRAFGAIVKDNDILMVHEVYKDREFWTLPGGGLEKVRHSNKPLFVKP